MPYWNEEATFTVATTSTVLNIRIFEADLYLSEGKNWSVAGDD